MLKFFVLLVVVVVAFVVGFTAREPVVVHVQSPPEIVHERVPVIVDVPGPVQYVDRVHTVYRIRNHYTVKRIPQQCPSVADALNRYELDIHGSF